MILHVKGEPYDHSKREPNGSPLLSFLLPVTPKQLLNSIEHSVMGGCNASAGVLLALGVQ